MNPRIAGLLMMLFGAACFAVQYVFKANTSRQAMRVLLMSGLGCGIVAMGLVLVIGGKSLYVPGTDTQTRFAQVMILLAVAVGIGGYVLLHTLGDV